MIRPNLVAQVSGWKARPPAAISMVQVVLETTDGMVLKQPFNRCETG